MTKLEELIFSNFANGGTISQRLKEARQDIDNKEGSKDVSPEKQIQFSNDSRDITQLPSDSTQTEQFPIAELYPAKPCLDMKEKVAVMGSFCFKKLFELYDCANEGLVKEVQEVLESLFLTLIQQILEAIKTHIQYHKVTFDQAQNLSPALQGFDNKEGSVDISHEKQTILHDCLLHVPLFEPSDSTQTKRLRMNAELQSTKAKSNMKKYGKILVNAVPDEATKIHKVLCTDYQPSSANNTSPQQEQKVQRVRREEFIHNFVHQKPKMIDFLENVVQIDEELLKDYNALLLFSQSKFALGRAYENEAASSVPDGAQNVNQLRECNSSSSSDDEDLVRFNWHELDFNSLFSRWLSESSISEDVDSSEDESESESTFPDERLNNAYGEQLDHNLSDDHSSSIQEYPRSLLCETCTARVRNVRFGCGHVACSRCTKNKDKCPECEKHITKRTLMYI